MNKETPVPLSQLMLSQEGFFDPVKNFFGVGSNKGKDYKPVEQKHTYNNKALVTAIMRQYGNDQWLNKQNWVMGSVKASDVLPYLTMGQSRVDPNAILAQCNAFYIKVYTEWRTSLKAYYKSLQPVIKVLSKGLTDEALIEAEALLKKIPVAEAFYKYPPRSFPVQSRPLPKRHNNLRPIRELSPSVKTKALNKTQVKTLVASMVKTLNEAEAIKELIFKEAELSVKPCFNPKLYQLAHSKNATIPSGSALSLERWVALAKRIDPAVNYWSSGKFTTTRTCYSELVLAITHWVDRSIK